MKSIGIVRPLDKLGRIVLPIELRRLLNIAAGDLIEILQSELLNERQHNRELSDRLAVLADQAQKLQLAQLSRDNNNQIERKENTKKPHWWNKRKGVKNNGRKKNVCEVNN